MMKRCATFALALTLSAAPAFAGKPTAESPVVPVLEAGQEPTWLKQALAGKKLDAAAFASFVAEAKTRVQADLAARQVALDPAFSAWLDADRQIHDAAYAAILPADSHVVENLQKIWKELDRPTFQRFRHLALGASILRRQIGVGPIADPVHNFKHGIFDDLAADAKKAGVPVESFLLRREPHVTPYKPEVFAAVDAFKAAHGQVQCDALWHDAALRAELVKTLAPFDIKADKAADVLEDWMIARKIRPAQRSDAPSVAAYIAALAKRLDTRVDFTGAETSKHHILKWPMFPVDKAPWPVLMGLGLTWPLDESDYIFAKLQGQQGAKRLHTYGPYRHGGDEMTADGLAEIPFGRGAWPLQIRAGGVCGTMATLAAGTYISLGVPMYKTGQPGHGNLLSYRATDEGFYFVRVEQSASAGPDGTYTEWPFADQAHPRTRFAECHMGLALAMNAGLDSWLRSRAALHAFRLLPPARRAAEGRPLLDAALAENPFNAELWYELADLAPDTASRLALLRKLDATITGSLGLAESEIKDINADLSDEKEVHASASQYNVQFRTLVRDIILQEKFNAVASLSPEQRREVLALAEGPWKGNDSRILGALRVRLQLSLQDPAKNLAELRSSVQEALQAGKSARKAEKAALIQLKQLDAALPDAKMREDFLKETLALFNEKNGVSTGKKAKLNPILENIAEQLVDLYSASGRSKEAKALKRQLDGWIKAKT